MQLLLLSWKNAITTTLLEVCNILTTTSHQRKIPLKLRIQLEPQPNSFICFIISWIQSGNHITLTWITEFHTSMQPYLNPSAPHWPQSPLSSPTVGPHGCQLGCVRSPLNTQYPSQRQVSSKLRERNEKELLSSKKRTRRMKVKEERETSGAVRNSVNKCIEVELNGFSIDTTS